MPKPAGLVFGDAARLQQVVWNLLTNAIKFSRKGSVVSVLVRTRNSRVEIVVRDSGEGMEPAFLPLVFERFSQEEAGLTRKHGGLGLGLAIVRHLVELHGGTVEASSEGKGLGSTFRVVLPVCAVLLDTARNGAGTDLSHDERTRSVETPVETPVEGLRRESSTVPSLVEWGGTRALVVDDDPFSRELVTHVLSTAGLIVVEAESAMRALEVLGQTRIDVLVSDIGMPQRTGLELVRAIRASESTCARLPALALTAYSSSLERHQALAAGYDAHVAKPVRPSELLGLLESLLDPSRSPASER